ncbi:HAMP domain-containing histidine kinase [Marivibrio halodurans]|uniref:histidine kinase n=1 Tax=Marivibrio halodurans TaxID=2039722 RepID=A0A8J7V4J8_9PROT|nr:HAMP domain-containing sensor histidine kinase [Marivibrio halodurans]MBP5857764.1 HAMP domain-containing histidine kinase [Marivibrio halodurans]
MRFYTAMTHLSLPRSYLGKILLVSFLGVHVPLIGTVLYVVIGSGLSLDDSFGILLALLMATLLGTVATLAALHALLAPVTKASDALRAYLADGTIPVLPTRHGDRAGILLANVQEAVTRLDLALDATRRQRDEAVTTKREKFEMLAGLSHDLRTPLNHVIGFAELLSTEALGPLGRKEYVNYAEDIGTSGGDLLSVVTAILDLSGAEAGTACIEMEPLSLLDGIRRAINLAHHKAQRRGIALEIDSDISGDMMVTSDPRYLKQVLLHLLEIAIDAPDSTTRVFVAAAPRGGKVTIYIESDAAWADGDVPPEFQTAPGVLESFEKVKASTMRHTSPSALRLSLVASLARLIDGSLKVGTSINGGRQMAVALPDGGAPLQEVTRHATERL